jgi:hypothetical protein
MIFEPICVAATVDRWGGGVVWCVDGHQSLSDSSLHAGGYLCPYPVFMNRSPPSRSRVETMCRTWLWRSPWGASI